MKPISIAVCISGQMRSFPENYGALNRMFANAGGEVSWFAALHAQDMRLIYGRPWAALSVIDMKPRPEEFAEIALQYPPRPFDRIQAAWEAWQGLLGVGALLRSYEKARGQRFDWVVRCRPDLEVVKPMERLETLSPDAIYAPKHDNWNGFNDRFAFGPSLLMQQWFEYPRHAARFFLRPSIRPHRNLEVVLAWHLGNERIPIKRTSAVLTPNRGNHQLEAPAFRADRGDPVP